MEDNGWDTGKNDEELFELAMHDRQYRDYKSGIAKTRFEEELNKLKTHATKVEKVVAEPITPVQKPAPDDPNVKSIISPFRGQLIFGFHEILINKFIKVGDKVKKGQRICYIYVDTYQSFEEVFSEYEGEVIEIKVKQGAPVSKGNIIEKIKINNN